MPVTGTMQALPISRDQHAVAPFTVILAAVFTLSAPSWGQLHSPGSVALWLLGSLAKGCIGATTNAKKSNDVRGLLSIPFWDTFLPWVHLSVAPVLQVGPSPFCLLSCNLLWFQLPRDAIVSFCIGANVLLFCLPSPSFTFLFLLCLYNQLLYWLPSVGDIWSHYSCLSWTLSGTKTYIQINTEVKRNK